VKTHELASALQQLAKLLRSGPDVELQNARPPASASDQLSSGEVAVGLTTLVELSRIDKQQWIHMIRDFGFDIPIRPADASRDVLGKLLRFLDKHPGALQKLRENANRSKSSPQLMRALDALLKEE
jgi:hypothetical protein